MAKSKRHADFADRLRAAMAQRGWQGRGAASQLARALGVTPSLAASYLRGERIPEGDTALKLPAVLGVDAGFFAMSAVAPAAAATVPPGAPARPASPRSGHPAVSEPVTQPLPQRAPTGTLPAPAAGHPLETEVMQLATRALGHAVRFVLGPEDFNNPGMCRQLALELEAFGDRLKDRLGLIEAAADLYKAALTLRRAVGDKVKMIVVAALISSTTACAGEGRAQREPDSPDASQDISARVDSAWRQCDLRARAGAGSYTATYQLCLQDHYGFPEHGARRLTEAMSAYRTMLVSLRTATFATAVWPDFRNYRGLLRGAAAVLGAAPAWADSLVRLDSVPLAHRDSSEQAARRAFDREVQSVLQQWRRERADRERQDSLLERQARRARAETSP